MYRDENDAASIRAETRQAEAGLPPTLVAPNLTKLYAKRIARIATPVFAVLVLAISGVMVGLSPIGGLRWHMTYGLVAVWLLSPIFYAAARVVSRYRIRARLGKLEQIHLKDASAIEQIIRKEGGALSDWLGERTQRMERLSWAFPASLLAFIAPLSIHFVVGALFMNNRYARDFDRWMVMTMAMVGAAHLFVAIFTARHVILVQREMNAGKIPIGAKRGWVTMGFATAAGCVPGALLVGIPPLLVAATGSLYLPLLFSQLSQRMGNERGLIESLQPGEIQAFVTSASRESESQTSGQTPAEHLAGV